MEKTNKKALRIFLIVFPTLAIMLGYFFYRELFPQSETKAEAPKDQSDFFGNVGVQDTSAALTDKQKIYERERQTEDIENDKRKRVVTDDDFFKFDNEEKKSISDEVGEGAKIVASALPEGKTATVAGVGKVPVIGSGNQTKLVEPASPKSVGEPVVTPVKVAPKPKPAPKGLVTPPSITNNRVQSQDPVNAQQTSSPTERRGFYSSGANGTPNKGGQAQEGETTEMTEAVIHNDQKVRSGEAIRIRTVEETMISGKVVPANTYLTGICQFGSERVSIRVTSLNLEGRIVKTSLVAYETDGVAGIYIPGGIKQQVATDAARSTVNNAGTKLNIPIVGQVVIGAGNAKISDPTVSFPAGYKILLRYEK